MAGHLSLRGIQQSLAARNIRCSRVEPYKDGRTRFAVWQQGKPRITATHSDDLEHVYILGLRMASNRSNAHA